MKVIILALIIQRFSVARACAVLPTWRISTEQAFIYSMNALPEVYGFLLAGKSERADSWRQERASHLEKPPSLGMRPPTET
jgi:hypothetical protein